MKSALFEAMLVDFLYNAKCFRLTDELAELLMTKLTDKWVTGKIMTHILSYLESKNT